MYCNNVVFSLNRNCLLLNCIITIVVWNFTCMMHHPMCDPHSNVSTTLLWQEIFFHMASLYHQPQLAWQDIPMSLAGALLRTHHQREYFDVLLIFAHSWILYCNWVYCTKNLYKVFNNFTSQFFWGDQTTQVFLWFNSTFIQLNIMNIDWVRCQINKKTISLMLKLP